MSEQWNQGKVVFRDSAIKYGLLNFDFNTNILRINMAGQLLTYSPFLLNSFEYIDSETGEPRFFQIFPYPKSSDYLVDMVFEILADGKLQLLCTQKVVWDYRDKDPNFYNNESYPGGNNTGLREINYTYMRDYFLRYIKDGKIKPLRKFKKTFEEFIAVNDSLKLFVKQNKIKYHRHYDMIKIINRYNQLNP